MDIAAERENIKKFDPEEAEYCQGLLDEIEQLQAEKKQLRKVIEAAISQHHRVRPNTVVDILIREYEALNKSGE